MLQGGAYAPPPSLTPAGQPIPGYPYLPTSTTTASYQQQQPAFGINYNPRASSSTVAHSHGSSSSTVASSSQQAVQQQPQHQACNFSAFIDDSPFVDAAPFLQQTAPPQAFASNPGAHIEAALANPGFFDATAQNPLSIGLSLAAHEIGTFLQKQASLGGVRSARLQQMLDIGEVVAGALIAPGWGGPPASRATAAGAVQPAGSAAAPPVGGTGGELPSAAAPGSLFATDGGASGEESNARPPQRPKRRRHSSSKAEGLFPPTGQEEGARGGGAGDLDFTPSVVALDDAAVGLVSSYNTLRQSGSDNDAERGLWELASGEWMPIGSKGVKGQRLGPGPLSINLLPSLNHGALSWLNSDDILPTWSLRQVQSIRQGLLMAAVAGAGTAGALSLRETLSTQALRGAAASSQAAAAGGMREASAGGQGVTGASPEAPPLSPMVPVSNTGTPPREVPRTLMGDGAAAGDESGVLQSAFTLPVLEGHIEQGNEGVGAAGALDSLCLDDFPGLEQYAAAVPAAAAETAGAGSAGLGPAGGMGVMIGGGVGQNMRMPGRSGEQQPAAGVVAAGAGGVLGTLEAMREELSFAQREASSARRSEPSFGSSFARSDVSYMQRDGSFAPRDSSFSRMEDSFSERDGSYSTRDGSYSTRDGSYSQRDGSVMQRTGSFGQPDGSFSDRGGWSGQRMGCFGRTGSLSQTPLVALTASAFPSSYGTGVSSGVLRHDTVYGPGDSGMLRPAGRNALPGAGASAPPTAAGAGAGYGASSGAGAGGVGSVEMDMHGGNAPGWDRYADAVMAAAGVAAGGGGGGAEQGGEHGYVGGGGGGLGRQQWRITTEQQQMHFHHQQVQQQQVEEEEHRQVRWGVEER